MTGVGEGEGPSPGGSRAVVVASGIFASRILGFLRERTFTHFLGVGPWTDVLTSALRGPNALQVLLGEQTLSAAFIPIYSRLLEEGREEDAGRFAGAVFGLLLALVSGLVLLAVLLARPLVALFAAGYLGDAAKVAAGEMEVDRYEMVVQAVHWIFPMAGILVLAAWSLGILNSHRRFFLPYFSPVLWNGAMITAALLAVQAGGFEIWSTGSEDDLQRSIVMASCAGALVGGLLQFGIQLPLVFRLAPHLKLSLSTKVPGVKAALRAFGPAVAGRGVVQVSLYLDQLLASLLMVGAVAAQRWGSFLYALPISLFAMSVAAAELPELSRLGAGAGPKLLQRMNRSQRQILFLVIPTTVGFLLFGFLLVGLVYRSGKFGEADHYLVTAVLTAYTLGLPASTSSRLLQNLFFALGDTRTPAKVAGVRVGVAAVLGAGLMFWLDTYPVEEVFGLSAGVQTLYLGAVGLALGSAVGSWLEIGCLRWLLGRRIPGFALPVGAAGRLGLLAVATAVPAALLWRVLPDLPWLLLGPIVIGVYAALYLGAAWLLKMEEIHTWVSRVRRR